MNETHLPCWTKTDTHETTNPDPIDRDRGSCLPPRHRRKTLAHGRSLNTVPDNIAPRACMVFWFPTRSGHGSNYRRPYLAVWLEDADGFPVKMRLVVATEQTGPRWHRI